MAWLVPVIAPAAQAQLDEVTVTARRISESLYDVSVTATVVDGGTLDDQVVTRWEDLALPGTKIGPAGITDVLSIRGMASGINFGFEQSAPVFIDGVWFGSSRASRIGFLDTAQVEVLKGPQPTWYGKNVMAGAFGISTRKPKFEREGWLEVFHEFDATARKGVRVKRQKQTAWKRPVTCRRVPCSERMNPASFVLKTMLPSRQPFQAACSAR